MVDSVVSPPAEVAAQKLPNPWVGMTFVSSLSSAASRRAELYWCRASWWVCASPSRSGRPVEPKSREPPENTAGSSPSRT
ncbi:Uncharacterised protein [Mycobacteroides abscessus subsp. abscessus]|nr:Uncharacterised protein [Mycobacteroides abscessus subsp. abscessus]